MKSSDRDLIKKNTTAREKDLKYQQSQEALARKAMGAGISEDFDDVDGPRGQGGDYMDDMDDESEQSNEDADDGDVVAAMRKRRKDMAKEVQSAIMAGDMEAVSRGTVATRWEDSQLAREQRARAASAARSGNHETVRDSQDAAKEELERESEKNKTLGKDPLGIIQAEDFDLRDIEKNQGSLIEQAMIELKEELQKAEAGSQEKLARKIAARKDSIEALIENLGGLEAMENTQGNRKKSIKPTSPNFDPILFLTLVHRNASYETLIGSLERLSSKFATTFARLSFQHDCSLTMPIFNHF